MITVCFVAHLHIFTARVYFCFHGNGVLSFPTQMNEAILSPFGGASGTVPQTYYHKVSVGSLPPDIDQGKFLHINEGRGGAGDTGYADLCGI